MAWCNMEVISIKHEFIIQKDIRPLFIDCITIVLNNLQQLVFVSNEQYLF